MHGTTILRRRDPDPTGGGPALGSSDQLRVYATMAGMASVRRSALWTVLCCLWVGASAASCSASANSPPAKVFAASATTTTTTTTETSSPPRLGPAAAVQITFDGAYALSAEAVGHIDAVACGGVHGEWRGTVTLDDQFLYEKSKHVTWTFDGTGKAEVSAGYFDYGLSSGEHWVLFLIDLRLIESNGSRPSITVDDVVAVQPGFGTGPDHASPQPPFPVTLGPVPSC